MAGGPAVIPWLAACGGPDAPPATRCDASLDWENAGAPFTVTWCAPCHSSGLVGDARFGAPVGVDLDTLPGVRRHADRIRVRALGEDPTMPPAAPAPADERARFEAWLDCGAPGTTTPPAPACAGETAPGDLVSGTDGPPCPGVTAVAGDLVWEADEPGWDCLCSVGGAVRIGAGAGALVLPALAAAGALEGTPGSALTRIDLPALEDLAGAIELRDQPALVEIHVPLLGHAAAVVLEDVPALVEVEAFRLTHVDGAVRIARAPALDAPVLDGLEVVGALELSATGAREPLLARRLVAVEGDVVLSDNPALLRLGGLDNLERIDGTLAIERNPLLAEVSGLPGPSTVGGDLFVRDNPELPAEEASGLAGRLLVEGTVDLSGNGP